MKKHCDKCAIKLCRCANELIECLNCANNDHDEHCQPNPMKTQPITKQPIKKYICAVCLKEFEGEASYENHSYKFCKPKQ